MKEFYAAIDEHLAEYEKGTITISEDIEFSMRQTVRQITHYIMSRYLGGQTDEQGRRKPFRNIGNAIVDIEWRAKNIDRKSIEAHETDGDYVFSMVVNKETQQWMKTNNFGKTIDDYQRKKSEYGDALLKRTETADELLIEPVKWEHTSVDPRDITDGMKIEKNYLSPLTLKKKRDVWNEPSEDDEDKLAIDVALEAHQKARKATKESRIEILDIEGEFEYCDLYDDESDDDTIDLYNVIVAVENNKKYCLYKTELKESRFKHDKRKEVEGRDFGMGVWEEVFEPQIFTNEAVIGEKIAMDLAGKVVLTSNKKDLASGAELLDGEVIELEADEYLKPVQLMPSALPEFQNQIDNWFINMQRDQSAFPGVTGEQGKAGQPFASLSLEAAQGGSIFNKRRDQDGYFLLEVLTDWVIPFIIKQINKNHTLTASYSDQELQQIDQLIVEQHANNAAKSAILSGQMFTQAHKDQVAADMQNHLNRNGRKRTLFIPKGFITLDKINQKVRFDITDEMKDDQRELNSLATVLGALAPNDPQRGAIIQQILEITGNSPSAYPGIGSAPAPAAPQGPATASRVQQVLPAGQQ